jgi:hypothetical protein
MADKERQSFTKRTIWKVLNVLPWHTREPQHISSYRPRVVPDASRVRREEDIHCQLEPEIRHLAPRKRPLSLVSSCYDEDIRQPLHTNQQTALFFYKLPREVRLMIYEELLGGMIFHIVRRREKLGHKLCKGSGDPEQCISEYCRGYKVQSGFHAGRGNGGLIQILQSCREL